MKFLLLLFLFIFLVKNLSAQDKEFTIHKITLPPELSYYDNQFSGLQFANDKLYLLSESRLEDKQEAKIYAVKLADIEKQLTDTTYVLPYEKIMITGLDKLADQMKDEGQVYEGLEAFILDGGSVFLSVETNTPSPYCYLLKGKWEGNIIQMLPTLTKILKPRKPDGSSIYNAGYEAITLIKKNIFAFFEYNYFDSNYVYCFNSALKPGSKDSLSADKLPFRITDITPTGNNHFTAINFFYKGEGGDTVYRVPPSDTFNDSLIETQGVYHNYVRLIDVEFKSNHFTWKPLWTFPKEYTGHNWEGIAACNNGYFVMNDKYTLTRPYASVLLYLK
jgi:hypothetical protein